jgi:hypothetical protein
MFTKHLPVIRRSFLHMIIMTPHGKEIGIMLYPTFIDIIA